MVEAGEVDALVPERVWQELSRGLMEARPSRMIEVLRDCGERCCRRWMRCSACRSADYHLEIDTGVHLMMVLDMADGWAPRCWCASARLTQ